MKSKHQIRAAIICAGLILASAGAVPAQQKPVTRADVNGEWNGVLDLEGGSHPLTFVFELTDSAFAGRVYDSGQSFGEMERGRFVADTVQFYAADLRFTGVIAGAKMKVALIVFNGSTRTFEMTKKPDPKKG
jgi:hypothetical protein